MCESVGTNTGKQPILSLTLTADHAIPETAARVHDLRAKGFNIVTRINPKIVFRGEVRRNVASYSLGVPEWKKPNLSDGTTLADSIAKRED